MRSYCCVFSLLCLVFPIESRAAPIEVRAGEHDGFTRLVMELPTNSTWQLDQTSKTVSIAFDGHRDGFDTSRTFEIIPKSRLLNTTSQDGVLNLELACLCTANAFTEQGRFLVVDIEDTPFATLETEARVPSSVLPSSDFSFGDLLWDGEDGVDANVDAPTFTTANKSDEQIVAEREIFLQTQSRLLEAFSEAATRGLINVEESIPSREVVTEEKMEEALSVPSPPHSNDNQTGANIRITSSGSSSQSVLDDNQNVLGLSGQTCPNPNTVDISQWSSGKDFGNQLASSNQVLFDELGRLDSTEVIRRAKLYIYFGFGAEALQTLQLLPDTEAGYPELYDIATILEFGYSANPRTVHKYADCPSDISLWSLLAQKRSGKDFPFDLDAVLRAFEKLPEHLRKAIGKDLSRHLASSGNTEKAEIAMRISERASSSIQNEASLAGAAIAASENDNQETIQLLEKVISQGTIEAPIAVVEKVNHLVRKGEKVPAELALTVEAFSFQFRTGELGEDLRHAHILASASSGQFGKAFDLVRTQLQSESNSHFKDAVDHVFTELSDHASNIAFLEYAIDGMEIAMELAGTETQFAIAGRLFQLGFLSEAQAIVDGIEAGTKSRNILLLSAKINTAMERPNAALLDLRDVTGPDAELLRGGAFMTLGNEALAGQAFRNAEAYDEASRAEWLSDNWTQSIHPSNPIFGPAQVVATEDIPKVSIDGTMLSQVNNVLESSEAARLTLRQLLTTLDTE